MSQTTSGGTGGGGGFATITTLMRSLVSAVNGAAAAIQNLSPFSQAQSPNLFYATPASGDGAPAFRGIAAADLPAPIDSFAETQPANEFLAAPNGAAGIPAFRAMVGADLPAPLNGATESQAENLFLASPSGATGTPSFRAITAADIAPFVLGGSWNNVLSDRAVGTIYTNSRTKPIMVSTWIESNEVTNVYGFVNGVVVTVAIEPEGGYGGIGLAWIVPPGATYELTVGGGTISLQGWLELY